MISNMTPEPAEVPVCCPNNDSWTISLVMATTEGSKFLAIEEISVSTDLTSFEICVRSGMYLTDVSSWLLK